MSATMKPIDWTRPLRTTDCHDKAVVYGIDPDAERPISIHVPATGWRGDLTREGYGHTVTSVPLVENVPPEPVIVERFAVVRKMAHGVDGHPSQYEISGSVPLMMERSAAVDLRNSIKGPFYYVARVLIEEDGR